MYKYLNIIFIIHIIWLLISCVHENKEEQSIEIPEEQKVESDPEILLKSSNKLLELDTNYTFGQGNEIIYDWSPHHFDTLSKQAFLLLQNSNKQSLTKDSSLAFINDSLFTIHTATAQLSYNHKISKTSTNKWSDFNGYIEPFKLYIVTTWMEGSILVGSMKLIDSTTNIGYNVISVSDGPTEIPTVSTDEKYLLVHSYNYHYSNVTILETTCSKGDKGNFKELISFSVNGLIEEINWVGNNKICFMLDDQNYHNKNLNKEGYYISKLPVDELNWTKSNNSY